MEMGMEKQGVEACVDSIQGQATMASSKPRGQVLYRRLVAAIFVVVVLRPCQDTRRS